jgi:hypothetical protein
MGVQMSLENIKPTLRQFLALKAEAELITNRVNDLKKILIEEVENYGEEGMNGHIYLNIDDEIKGSLTLTKQRKVSNPLDIEIAEKLLEERGIKNECIKMIPTLDDSAIMAAHYTGKLSEEDIDAMFPAKVSWAFIVK